MSCKYFLSAVFCLLVYIFTAGQAAAQESEVQIFDSTDHYLGACQQTDKAEWTLDKDLEVTTFQIWYNWLADEKEFDFVLNKDGDEFIAGTVTRTTCDTYQKNWCNGDLKVDRTFPAGEYSLTIDNPRMCLKPGGTGAIRLYGPAPEPTGEAVVTNSEPIPTTEPAMTVAPTVMTTAGTCPESTTGCAAWLLPALGASGILNLVLIILVLKK